MFDNAYIPRSKNVIQSILENHFPDLESFYAEKYADSYGKFKLQSISEKVHRFPECGDYTKGFFCFFNQSGVYFLMGKYNIPYQSSEVPRLPEVGDEYAFAK